jgi:hypothetical protein
MPLAKPSKLGLPAADRPVLDEAGAPKPPEPAPAPLVPGSVTAKALLRAWGGRSGEVTAVDSPPGAGKTTLAVTVAAHLVVRARARVVVATPTRAQAVGVCWRLASQIPASQVHCRISQIPAADLPRGVKDGSLLPDKDGWVQVRTLASLGASPTDADLLIVDEAYQATFDDVISAADGADRLLLVGDPGQIGPVITFATGDWDRLAHRPHRRAPEGFSGAERHHLPSSRRLGPASVEVVAPFYRFGFGSDAPDRHVEVAGRRLGEIETLGVPGAAAPESVECCGPVAERAWQLATGATLVDGAGSGDGRRPIRPGELAVVVARNAQVSVVTALLAERGVEAVIGTADRLQGGEWPVVVALDPVAGAESLSEHTSSTGRLCVMLSRHTHHLTWVTDPAAEGRFEGGPNREIRSRLARFNVATAGTGTR